MKGVLSFQLFTPSQKQWIANHALFIFVIAFAPHSGDAAPSDSNSNQNEGKNVF